MAKEKESKKQKPEKAKPEKEIVTLEQLEELQKSNAALRESEIALLAKNAELTARKDGGAIYIVALWESGRRDAALFKHNMNRAQTLLEIADEGSPQEAVCKAALKAAGDFFKGK